MTDPIDPVRATGDRRSRVRRKTDPAPARDAHAEALPVPAAPQAHADEPQPILSAHLMGQSGQKRGLRGGPETLAKARAAYLTAEWSGPGDRRLPAGLISKTKV